MHKLRGCPSSRPRGIVSCRVSISYLEHAVPSADEKRAKCGVAASQSVEAVSDGCDGSNRTQAPVLMRHKWPSAVGATLSLLAIAVLTLGPDASGVRTSSPTCLLCGARGSADSILNLVLFAPFGAALSRLGLRLTMTVAVGLLLSSVIEIGQTMIPGRAPTLGDVLMNGIGSGLGALVAQRIPQWLRSSRAPRAAWTSAVAAVLIVAITGWLLQPQVKPSGSYGHLSPRLGHLEPWSGRVDSVTVGTTPLRHGLIADARVVRESVSGRMPLMVYGSAATPPRRLAALFLITDDDFEEMLLIGQQGNDLIVRARRRAASFLLAQPDLRFTDAFSGLPVGAPLVLVVRSGDTRACIAVNAHERCSAPLAASSTWSLLFWPRSLPRHAVPLLGALTLLALFIPAGAFGAALPARQVLALSIASAGGLIAAAAATGLAPVAPWEWLGVLAGLLVGRLIGPRVSRSGQPTARQPRNGRW